MSEIRPGRLLPWVLLALLLLAFALRLARLDSQSLWYDEAVTAQVVQQGLPELARWTADDIQPPLYYAVLAAWTRLAGTGEWALRFPSAAFGLLAVPLACALGRRLFGWRAGLLAALLAAVHPLWLYYSQEARMYTMLTALGMLAGYALLRVLGIGDASATMPGMVSHSNSPGSTAGNVPGPAAGSLPESGVYGDLLGSDAGKSLPGPDAGGGSAGQGGRTLWWLAFAGAAVAMLYTHYFALFLLLAFALFFLLALAVGRGPGRGRLLGEGLLVAAGVFLAYLPWLPNAVRRFGEDASYWRGTLKLDEALRHVAISFTTGETVLEAQATPLAWTILALAVAATLLLLWQALRSRPAPVRAADPSSSSGPQPPTSRSSDRQPSSFLSLLFVLLYLLVPVISILALSYRTPKFNPRYLMLASPALVLLLAGGLAVLLAPNILPGGRSSPWRTLWRAAGIVGLALVLAVSLYADLNWFADPAFTKDDWRGAVALVRGQLAGDEAVALVSGHAYPVWRYYAPAVEPLRLPDTPTLDVTTVLDLGVGTELGAGLAGRQGVWLLQWQDEVVDPTGAVPFLLSAAGAEQPVAGSFWGLGTPRHYRFPQPVAAGPNGTFSSPPAAEVPLSANFDNEVELLGYSQLPCEAGEPACPLHLFWRALAPLTADLKLSATLFDAAGGEVGPALEDRRLAAYEYPTFRWPAGTIIHSELALSPEPGTPPGEYRLRLEVYDDATGESLPVLDAAGAAQGPWAWLDPVAVQALVPPTPEGEPPAIVAGLQVAPGLTLQDLQPGQAEVEPGDTVALAARWLANQQPSQDYVMFWQWVDPAGRVASSGTHPPGGAGFPTTQWPTGALVRTRLAVPVPQDAAPGSWVLRIGLQPAPATAEPPASAPAAPQPAATPATTAESPTTTTPAAQPQKPPTATTGPSTAMTAATAAAWAVPVVVRPSSRLFEPSSPPAYPAQERFGEAVELLGLTAPIAAVPAGTAVPVTVVWRALTPINTSYTGFVHLLDAQGQLVAQDDHVPLQGEKPTTSWVAGEIVEDRYELPLPPTLPSGTYRLEVGLYDSAQPGLPRLRLPDGRDSILLGDIIVAE